MRQRLDTIYPEGTGRRGAAPRDGAPAPLIKQLFVNGKDAVYDMWKERGYVDMTPDEIRDRLGYRLDREEATGCVVTSARNLPLLVGLEARNIGKRIVASVIPSGAIGKKLKELKKRGKSTAVYLREPATLNLDPPKKPAAASSELPPEELPPEELPPEELPPEESPPSTPSPLLPQPPPSQAMPPLRPPPPSKSAPPQPPQPHQATAPVKRLLGSKEAADVTFTARELEFAQWSHRDTVQRSLNNPSSTFWADEVKNTLDIVSDLEKVYAEQLRAVKAAFPRMVCCDVFESGGCAHGKPCECGWLQAPWPWIVHRQGRRFCDCHMEGRAAWIKPGGYRIWKYLNKSGMDSGHHFFPDSGPQRGNGS